MADPETSPAGDIAVMPPSWHDDGMPRSRISTTVDSTLLDDARRFHSGWSDSELIDAALKALVKPHRDAEIDAQYAKAYAEHPIDEPDEWGDLKSWSDAIKRLPRT